MAVVLGLVTLRWGPFTRPTAVAWAVHLMLSVLPVIFLDSLRVPPHSKRHMAAGCR